MAESVPAENETPQSPTGPARQEECDMVVSAAAIDTDMDLIGLMSEPGVATAGSGRQNNHEPQDSRSYISSPDPAQGGSTNPVGVKSLQGHMGCTQYMSQRNNDTMDIYMLQVRLRPLRDCGGMYHPWSWHFHRR
ncbi:hypothetical protein NP493_30g01014 [Ridgeia piscesae]|uniref:Uncharacterized protein n=1 Tax=Ridgeia piscesae TaxID=27915 RepID=A0AAD9PCZ6_RIDPI|nr:hypothetical protein NP493_30g01014 [Ridgeia piscesae]